MVPEFQPSGRGFKGPTPRDWSIESAVSVCLKITDGTHDTPKVADNGRPFITAIHVKNGKIDFANCLYLNEEDHRAVYKRCNPEYGDLAVVNIGAGVSECGYVDVDFEFSMKNVALLKPNKQRLLPEFLLQQHLFRSSRIAHSVKTGGAQPFLSLKDLRQLPIAIPPLAEQKKITEILSTWDQAIEKTETLIANSEAQKKALMQKLLTGKKRLPGFDGEWEQKTIKELGCVFSGGTPDSGVSEYWDGDLLWATPTDITALISANISNTARKITQTGLENSSAKLLPVGALLVCTRATVGDLAIADCEISTNQGFKNLIPNKSFNSEFLFFLFSFFKREFLRLACGSTFAELSKKDFERISFIIPEIKEQLAIAKLLKNASSAIEQLERKKEKLNKEKSALMQQLLTGKHRVKIEEIAA